MRVNYRGPGNIPDRALEVVKQLITSGIVPSNRIYESLLNIWLKSMRADSPRVAESIFRSMVRRTPHPPHCEPLSCCLRLTSRALFQMPPKKRRKFRDDDCGKCGTDTTTYSLVARAWSRSWRRTGAVPVIADAKTGEVIRLDWGTQHRPTAVAWKQDYSQMHRCFAL